MHRPGTVEEAGLGRICIVMVLLKKLDLDGYRMHPPGTVEEAGEKEVEKEEEKERRRKTEGGREKGEDKRGERGDGIDV